MGVRVRVSRWLQCLLAAALGGCPLPSLSPGLEGLAVPGGRQLALIGCLDPTSLRARLFEGSQMNRWRDWQTQGIGLADVVRGPAH